MPPSSTNCISLAFLFIYFYRPIADFFQITKLSPIHYFSNFLHYISLIILCAVVIVVISSRSIDRMNVGFKLYYPKHPHVEVLICILLEVLVPFGLCGCITEWNLAIFLMLPFLLSMVSINVQVIGKRAY